MSTFIEGSQLEALLSDSSKKAGKDFVIVDVRDEDFKYGNIKSAVNIPAHELLANPDAAVEQVLKAEPQTIIFHCALSQVRGPKSARAFAEAMKSIPGEKKPEVVVLRGGFNEFQKQYRDSDFLVNLDADAWDRGIMF
jgi:rhodanese-related sulfurtransferase